MTLLLTDLLARVPRSNAWWVGAEPIDPVLVGVFPIVAGLCVSAAWWVAADFWAPVDATEFESEPAELAFLPESPEPLPSA